MSAEPVYVSVQSRGVLLLPAAMRKRMHLDQPGAQVEIVERDDHVIELRPALPVPADQAWFWSEQWQAREHEADADYETGCVETFDTGDDFLAALDDHSAQA